MAQTKGTPNQSRANIAAVVMVSILILGVIMTQGYTKEWVSEANSIVNSIKNHSAQALAETETKETK